MKGVWLCCLVASVFLCASTASCEQGRQAAGIRVGMLWWPADPDQAFKALKNDVEDCLVANIHRAAPDVVFARQQQIRDALFPLLEPATQPATEEALATLLGRDDVRKRLASQGLRYLIVFSGGTSETQPGGGIVCGAGFGAGGCFGYSWQDETTRLDAAVWPLAGDRPLHRERAGAQGTTVVPAFILPLPIPAHSRETACRELGERLGQAILKIDADDAASGKAPGLPAERP